LILIVVVVCFFVFKDQPINSSDEAIKIAQKYVNKKYGCHFSEYNINATLDDNIWVVSYYKRSSNSEIVLGGGGPKVHIRQTDGKVISCLLQK